jgi:threonine/homoserine/homoserine lactone efflux protein
LFIFNGLLICMAWALAASWLLQRTRFLQRGLQHLDRLAGCMFVGFGLKLALTDAPAP